MENLANVQILKSSPNKCQSGLSETVGQA